MNSVIAAIVCGISSSLLYATHSEDGHFVKQPLLWDCQSCLDIYRFVEEGLNAENPFGYTKLHISVGATGIGDNLFKQYTQATEEIIENFLADKADPNAKNNAQRSPFFYAVTRGVGNDNLISTFLAHKADPNVYDEACKVILHYCDRMNMTIPRLKLLLDGKADPCLKVKKNPFSHHHLHIDDNKYPYEIAQDKEKRNLLLNAIPWWFLEHKEGTIKLFLLCMKYHQKANKISWPPRLVQYKILGISAQVIKALKLIQEIQHQEILSKEVQKNIKNMIDSFIAEYDKK